MQSWKNKRAEWTSVRDNQHKVAKGAVSGVSIGARLDKVYEVSKQGYTPLKAAVAKLKADVDTYAAKIRKMTKSGNKSTEKYAKLADWIKGHLHKDVLDLEKDVNDSANLLDKVFADRKAIAPDLAPFTWLNPSEVVSLIAGYRKYYESVPADKQPKPEEITDDKLYSKALAERDYVPSVKNTMTQLKKHASNLRSYEFKCKLPGQEKTYAQLTEFAADLDKAVSALAPLCSCKNINQLIAAWRPASAALTEVEGLLTTGLDGFVRKLKG